MNEGGAKTKGSDGQRDLSVRIRADLAEQLESFCREKKIPAGRVVERALIEYFREGEMSH